MPLFISDGLSGNLPTGSDWSTPSDASKQTWYTKLKAAWPPYNGFPANYTLLQQQRPKGASDRYLYGHPSGSRFRSPNEFIPHLLYLANAMQGTCECKYCARGGSNQQPKQPTQLTQPKPTQLKPVQSDQVIRAKRNAEVEKEGEDDEGARTKKVKREQPKAFVVDLTKPCHNQPSHRRHTTGTSGGGGGGGVQETKPSNAYARPQHNCPKNNNDNADVDADDDSRRSGSPPLARPRLGRTHSDPIDLTASLKYDTIRNFKFTKLDQPKLVSAATAADPPTPHAPTIVEIYERSGGRPRLEWPRKIPVCPDVNVFETYERVHELPSRPESGAGDAGGMTREERDRAELLEFLKTFFEDGEELDENEFLYENQELDDELDGLGFAGSGRDDLDEDDESWDPAVDLDLDSEVKHCTLRLLVSQLELSCIAGHDGSGLLHLHTETGIHYTVVSTNPRDVDRVLVLSGPMDAVAVAVGMAAGCISLHTSVVRFPKDPPRRDRNVVLRVLVNNGVIPHVVGVHGRKIEEVGERSGAVLNLGRVLLQGSNEKVLNVAGVQDAVQIAAYLVCKTIAEREDGDDVPLLQPFRPIARYVMGDWEHHNLPEDGVLYHPDVRHLRSGGEQLTIKSDLVGFIVGRRGMHVSEICQRTGCNVRIRGEQREQSLFVFLKRSQTYSSVTVTGDDNQGINLALFMLLETIRSGLGKREARRRQQERFEHDLMRFMDEFNATEDQMFKIGLYGPVNKNKWNKLETYRNLLIAKRESKLNGNVALGLSGLGLGARL